MAANAVLQQGIIAYPTEAVYGLGCLPDNYRGVARILALKKRSWKKGLILVAADSLQIEPYISYPDSRIREKVMASWPGPVTWLLPASALTPWWIRGKHKSVAVRVSNHPVVMSLCMMTGALVSTSANPEKFPPARHAGKVRNYFNNKLDFIVPGSVGHLSMPTEIRDAVSDEIIRKSP